MNIPYEEESKMNNVFFEYFGGLNTQNDWDNFLDKNNATKVFNAEHRHNLDLSELYSD